MYNYHSSRPVGRTVLCWEGEANHDHTSVAPRLASCFEAAIICRDAPGGVPVPSFSLLLCPLLRDHRPYCLFSCLFVCFHHNSSSKCGPDLLKTLNSHGKSPQEVGWKVASHHPGPWKRLTDPKPQTSVCRALTRLKRRQIGHRSVYRLAAFTHSSVQLSAQQILFGTLNCSDLPNH